MKEHAKDLLKACRPTTGLYALLMVNVSFRFFEEAVSWWLHIFTPLAFAALTMSIMVLNDLVDWERDAKQGKTFARDNREVLKAFWWRLNIVTGVLLSVVWVCSPWLGLYCTSVWMLGIGYSYVPHWYLLNNILVSICSASPALCGLVHHGQLHAAAVSTFFLFTLLILWNEIYKDEEDRKVDQGTKATLPTRRGHVITFLHLTGMLPLLMVPFLCHPNWWIKGFYPAMVIIAWRQSMTFFHPERIQWVMEGMRYVLQGILLILVITT